MRITKKAIKTFFDSLDFEPAELNNNPGKLVDDWRANRWNSKKDKKRKGHVTGDIIHPQMKWNDIHQQCLDPEIFWDEWKSHRDGWTKWYRDTTRYKKRSLRRRYNYYNSTEKPWYSMDRINNKINKLLNIRKIRKYKMKRSTGAFLGGFTYSREDICSCGHGWWDHLGNGRCKHPRCKCKKFSNKPKKSPDQKVFNIQSPPELMMDSHKDLLHVSPSPTSISPNPITIQNGAFNAGRQTIVWNAE